MNSLSSTLSRRALLNVPSPNPDRASYARFIPREELGDFASWKPGSFGFEPQCDPNRRAGRTSQQAGNLPDAFVEIHLLHREVLPARGVQEFGNKLLRPFRRLLNNYRGLGDIGIGFRRGLDEGGVAQNSAQEIVEIMSN